MLSSLIDICIFNPALVLNLAFNSVWLQSFDDDCTLEEEEGLVEEEDEIDQFNDDTFGAGAIGKCAVLLQPWQPLGMCFELCVSPVNNLT